MCGRGSKRAANRSHSNIKTLRRQKPNLQKFGDKRVCTRCVRTLKKVLLPVEETVKA
jgi:ribosomal protein L28